MSHLFADIYDGIRFLRILKGVSEKDILNYVQARVGNMKVGNVLKTIRTLRKLVDEGILIKKGKRYCFSGKSPKAECYESEDENQCASDDDDECDGEEDDTNYEDEEQEDDDDDEDDEGCGDEEDGEEDDFDEDEDENCDNDNQEGGDDPCNDEKKMEEENSKEGKNIDSKSSFIMRPRVEDNKEGNKANNNTTNKATENPGPMVSEHENERRRRNKRKRSFLRESATKQGSRSRGIAFCVRDFIDSLPPPKEEERKKLAESQETLQSNTESGERLEKYSPRNRGSRFKWEREPHCSYRSRSPVKGRNRNCHDNLHTGRSDDLGSSIVLFQDPADTEGEADEKKGEPRPDGPLRQADPQEGSQSKVSAKPLSKESKNVLEVTESEISPKESIIRYIPQNRAQNRGSSQRSELDDRRQERTKRGLSEDDVRSFYDDKAESLCSVCDKKRRNS